MDPPLYYMRYNPDLHSEHELAGTSRHASLRQPDYSNSHTRRSQSQRHHQPRTYSTQANVESWLHDLEASELDRENGPANRRDSLGGQETDDDHRQEDTVNPHPRHYFAGERLYPLSGRSQMPRRRSTDHIVGYNLDFLRGAESLDTDDFLNGHFTGEMPPPSAPRAGRRRPLEDDIEQSRPAKRTRRHTNDEEIHEDPEHVEAIDLSGEDGGTQALLEKQRADLLQTQEKSREGEAPKSLGQQDCVICMDHITDATATACGHYFCHFCLTQALISSERNSDRRQGTCPVCRKPLKRTNKGHIIPITFMTKKKFREIHAR